MQKTRQWMQVALSSEVDDSLRARLCSHTHVHHHKALEEFINLAWLMVVMSNNGDGMNFFSEELYPELMLLDRVRLVRMNKFVFAGIVSGLLSDQLGDEARMMGKEQQLSETLLEAMQTIWLSNDRKQVRVYLTEKALSVMQPGLACWNFEEENSFAFDRISANFRNYFLDFLEMDDEGANLLLPTVPWLQEEARGHALLLRQMVSVSKQVHVERYKTVIRDCVEVSVSSS